MQYMSFTCEVHALHMHLEIVAAFRSDGDCKQLKQQEQQLKQNKERQPAPLTPSLAGLFWGVVVGVCVGV
jgi:hypothetical protein